MALFTFGGGTADVVTNASGDVQPGVQLTVWTSSSRTTQITALYEDDGVTPLPGYVTTDAQGRYLFRASDAYTSLWLWDGNPSITPWLVIAHEAVDQIGEAITQAAQASADASTALAGATTATATSEAAETRSVAAEAAAEQALETVDAVAAATGIATGKKAATLSLLPGRATGEWGYNAAPWGQDNITTDGDTQYAVWWGWDKKPWISKRTLPLGGWSTPVDLSTWLGTVAANGHLTLAVAVDSDGYVHVTGNNHATALTYARSTAPGSIAGWATAAMTGSNEAQVTYPAFVMADDTTLLFFFRDGTSGNADLMLNRYDLSTQTWSRVGKIIDGKVSSESAYPNRFAVDRLGRIHVFFCWRGTGNANTNNDLCHFMLTEYEAGAPVAARMDGTAQALPVTHANAELVIDTAATGSGLINSHGADVDTENRPHTATWLFDGSGNTQIVHVYYDGNAWQQETVTAFTEAVDMDVSTLSPSLSRTATVCDNLGRTFIIFRCNHDGRRGSVRALNVTPGTALSEFKIADLDLYEWEPAIDSRAASERNELVMMLAPCTANGLSADETHLAENWTRQWIGVLTVDLAQSNVVSSGAANVPGVKLVSTQNGPPVGITVTATSPTDTTHGPLLAPERRGSLILCRLHARLQVDTSGCRVDALVKERRENPNATEYTVRLNGYAVSPPVIVETPWVPLRVLGDLNPDAKGWLQLAAQKANTGTGTISIASIQLAYIDEG